MSYTTWWKTIIGIILLGGVTSLILAACSTNDTPPAPGENVPFGISEIQYQLKDGRTVTCIIWEDAGQRGTMSCDWVTAGMG